MAWPFSGKDGLIEKIYLPYFHKHGEGAIPFLVKGTISRMAFLSAYKTLPTMDKMEETEKKEMKLFVNELFKGETPQFRLQACKIVYTIGTLL